jgi:cytolysin-activating lysine-acyltransferase
MSDDLTFGTDGTATEPVKPTPKKPASKAAAAKPASPKAAPNATPNTAPQSASKPASSAADQPQQAADDMSRILGQIVSLLGQSPSHKHVFLADLEWLVLPALIGRQVRVWRRNTERGVLPVAYASWAMVSAEVDQRLSQGQIKLKPSEWRSGNIPWLIDLVAPYGGGDAALQELADQVVPGGEMKTLVPNSGGGVSVRGVKGKSSA